MTVYKNLDVSEVKFNEDGLIPVIAQAAARGEVLMLAYMNRESLAHTLESGFVTYWSRSRQKLWKKGESSGHVQKLKSLALDCDGDALLVKIEQVGEAACHTGRRSCFYREAQPAGAWKVTSEPLFDPDEVYKKK